MRTWRRSVSRRRSPHVPAAFSAHPLKPAFTLPSSCLPAVEYSPFYGIEKGAVLQEARCFNDSHVDPRRCQQVITKLLYLLTQGESFTKVRIGWGVGGCCRLRVEQGAVTQEARVP